MGRVVDFSVVKAKVGAWLDAYIDHGMVLQRGDPMIAFLVEQANAETYNPGPGVTFEYEGDTPRDRGPFRFVYQTTPKLWVVDVPPTSENLARLIHEKATELLVAPLRVVRTVFWETPNCRAEYEPAHV